jgi:hypothetical protein
MHALIKYLKELITKNQILFIKNHQKSSFFKFYAEKNIYVDMVFNAKYFSNIVKHSFYNSYGLFFNDKLIRHFFKKRNLYKKPTG